MPEATLDDIDRPVAVRYAARDADATFRIQPILSHMIDVMGLRECYEMDMGIVPMIDRMQRIGMLIDRPHFERLGEELTHRMIETRWQIEDLTGYDINPGSGDQTAMLLIALGIPLTKMTRGEKPRESTNDKILESFRHLHPAVGLVCDYREFSKLKSSFCLVMLRLAGVDERIRTTIRLTRTSSGRLAANNPNMLGIPVRSTLGKEIRTGFKAGPGHILGAWDLDQVEMRTMADESEDPVLCGLFIRGEDVHRKTAGWMFGKEPANVSVDERRSGKIVGFGVINGITPIGLLAQMKLNGLLEWTEETCGQALVEYFKIYKGVGSYHDRKVSEARRFGYVRDRWGRIRYLPGVHSSLPRIREEANRQSYSHCIQAGAQGIIKRAMKVIWAEMRQFHTRWHNFYWEPLMQVHDELLFEMSDVAEVRDHVGKVVLDALCNTTKMRVPILAKGGFGPNWGSLKD